MRREGSVVHCLYKQNAPGKKKQKWQAQQRGVVVRKKGRKSRGVGSVKLSKEDLLGEHIDVFKKGIRVWAENPFPADSVAYRKNNEVYNPKISGPPVWVPAVIKEEDESRDEVVVETIWAPKTLARSSTDALYMLNEGNDVDDMVELSHLHEAALLHNIEKRFARSGKRCSKYTQTLVLSCSS